MVSNDDLRYAKLKFIDEIYTGPVYSGSNEVHTFTPPVGMLWELKQILMYVPRPGGSTSGTHNFQVFAGALGIIRGDSNFGKSLEWNNSHWYSADNSQEPATEVGAILALNSIVSDSNKPITVRYSNYTDVTQSNNRTIKFIINETPSL